MLNAVIRARAAERPGLTALYESLTAALTDMEAKLRELTRSSVPEVEDNAGRVTLSGGKRLRPALAWLCWRCAGREAREILPLMAMLELMHTASLVHDDVVDRSPSRRGVPTIQTVLGEGGAVCCGDFLLARAMELLHLYRGTGINEALSEVSVEMCLGELAQLEAACTPAVQSEADYFLQIRRKTASLLSASCFTGALAGGMTAAEAGPLRIYGLELGVAFQLKDDLLDFRAPKGLGKPRGQDLRRGLHTLPVRYAAAHSAGPAMLALLAAPERSEADIADLLAWIADSGGLEHTQRVLEDHSRRAAAALTPLPESPEKLALAELACTLAEREV